MPHHQQQESTTSTMPASINDLDEILSRKKFWTSDLQFNEEEDDEKEPRFTNVSQVLASQGFYFLPEHFKGSNKQARRKALVAVKLSAIKAGFSLVTRTSMTWRPIKPKTGKFQVVIVLVCSKANEYRATHDKSEENPRRTSTERPLCKEQLCRRPGATVATTTNTTHTTLATRSRSTNSISPCDATPGHYGKVFRMLEAR